MKQFRLCIILSFFLSLTFISHAVDQYSGGTGNLATTVSGGTGAVSDLESNDNSLYTVARGATMDVGGFASFGGAITSVYLFVEYTVDSGYTGTGALQVNGVNTTVVPADGNRTRHAFIDITGGSFGIDTSPEIEALSITFNNSDGGGGDSVHFDYLYLVINPVLPIHLPPTWSEEFDGANGTPADPSVWTYEQGYQRNEEDQYYVVGSSNGWHENGEFIIEARVENPPLVDGQRTLNYSSASIRSVGNYSWQYGRAHIRAKIPAVNGMWPAIWQVGDVGEWPYNGECDIMEYYKETIKANCAVGNGARWTAKWDSSTRTLASLLAVDPNWRNEYHIWTIQWDENAVRLYIDNILLNTINQSWLVNNGSYGGSPSQPFKQPHNIWLNLALGGNAGGTPPANNTFPHRYYIDYWRIWEGATDNVAPTDITLSNDSVGEGLPAGTVVGNLSAIDADPAEVHRYSLVSGTGDTHNSQFTIPEFVSDNTLLGVLKTAAVLDYDDGATRSIRVRVTDIEGAWYEKVLTINVMPGLAIMVSQSQLTVPEGGTNTFDVKLRVAPASDITVNVSRTAGDADISVSAGATLTFTPDNGTDWQTVTISAAEDADITNGTATISCVDNGGTFNSETVSVSESENDNDSPIVNAGQDQTAILVDTGAADPTPGADVFLDAGQDDETDTTWTDLLGLWSPTVKGTGLTYVANTGSSRSGITAAYDFPGAPGDGGFHGIDLEDSGLDGQPISLEIWFKPDQSVSYSSNGQILWETGGGTGFGIFYNDGFVEVAHDGNKGQISADVSGLTNEFIQVVVTYDTAATTDNFKLYINGSIAVTSSRDDIDLSGNDDAGLGRMGGGNAGGAGGGTAGTESFNGQIAIFRIYHNQILSAPEVTANYDSVVGATVTVDLDGTVTEPNGETTTVVWSLVSGPAVVTFGDAAAVDTTATFGAVGTYVLRLTADDGTSIPGYDDVVITVGTGSNIIVDVDLPAGISLYGYTGENSMDTQTAFQTLITNDQLSLVRWVNPTNGQIKELYYTTFPSSGWVNEIGSLTLGQGYVVKTKEACTLSISGNKSTVSVSLDLPQGYSIIGFNKETPMNAQAAFQPLIDLEKLELVRWVDPSNGQIKELYYTTYPSPAWVNEIVNLQEGQGYIIKLNAPHTGFTLP